MKLHGLQKMTLLDFPGHVACTVFLGGCDFRCPFCHNYELIDGTAQPVMDDGELISFLESRKGLLDGVAITGGEPCLHKELPELIRKIRAAGYPVKLDTNGYHPEMLKSIIDEGLVEYVAMDIKNSEEKYELTCGVDLIDLDKIRESISILINSGIEYEFRTTVIKEFHEEEDFVKMCEMIKGAKRYFLQRFTDRDSVPYGNLTSPSFDEMKEFAAVSRQFIPNTELRGVE
ncbi:MAG: anaerobic ribonucleoside-triphosphate reductase activating protein [Clostridiales bacterium]|nr:anaerobic ribonucleoside-triphosphate reductase activating protein [Clostridiales bacterium]